MSLIKPFGDIIVGIIPTTNEVRTSNGLVLPSDNKDASVEAKVVCAGPDVKLDLKDGDRIVYNISYSTVIDYGDKDEKMILIPEKYVYAKIMENTDNRVTFVNNESRAIDAIAKNIAGH